MERLLVIGGLSVVAGMCEIGGGYLVWGWMREHKPLAWALTGALILVAYGVVAALQPIAEFGRVYAAYGGVFIALALAWGILVDGAGRTAGTCWARRSAWRAWWSWSPCRGAACPRRTNAVRR
jgi:drug/metabolite transporter superfamily protein YnfA